MHREIGPSHRVIWQMNYRKSGFASVRNFRFLKYAREDEKTVIVDKLDNGIVLRAKGV